MTDPHEHHWLIDIYPTAQGDWRGLCRCGTSLHADTHHQIHRNYLAHLYANDRRDQWSNPTTGPKTTPTT